MVGRVGEGKAVMSSCSPGGVRFRAEEVASTPCSPPAATPRLITDTPLLPPTAT